MSGQASTYARAVYLKNTTDVQLLDVDVDLAAVGGVIEASGFRLTTSTGTEIQTSSASSGEYGIYLDGGDAVADDSMFTGNGTDRKSVV